MPTTPVPSRRGVLGAAAVAALAAGCDSARQTRKPIAHGPVVLPPDVMAAGRARTRSQIMRARVEETVRRYPGLAGVLAPVAAMHRAHEDALRSALSDKDQDHQALGMPLPPTRARALAQLANLERSHGQELVRLAGAAESGLFARLLASMAAAVDQRLAGWPT